MRNGESGPRILTDIRTIAGLLREALFLQRAVTARIDGRIFEFAILELVEKSSRDRDETRMIRLAWTSEPPSNLPQASEAAFECAFFEFVANWNGRLELLAEHEILVSLPTQLEIRNLRESRRYELGRERHRLQGSVLVQSNGYHLESQLRLLNVSREGMGGRISVPRGYPIGMNSTVRGVLHGDSGALELDGVITHINLISPSGAEAGDVEYRVGLRRRVAAGGNADSPRGERRRFERVAASEELFIRSPFNPAHSVRVRLSDLSVAGFAGQLKDPHDILLLPVGVVVQGEESSLLFRLVSVSAPNRPGGAVLHFQIHSGLEVDRLSWLRRVSRADLPGVHTASSTGGDIIELFCRAGALSSEYLKNNRSRSGDMVSGFASGFLQTPWLHRWIEREHGGGAIGHIGAVKLADNLWHVGDLAGTSEPDKKISRSFIPRFLTSFRDFCLSSSPCPRVIMTWNSGHPYWRNYERYLQGEGAHAVHAECRTRYTRFQRAVRDGENPGPGTGEVREVEPFEHARIESLLEQLKVSGLDRLARALDFGVTCFGSPGLRALTGQSEGGFFRRYYVVSSNHSRYLLIVSRFPDGSSPSRTFDVPWLLPLIRDPEDSHADGLPSGMLAQVRRLALESGVSPPGILEALVDVQGGVLPAAGGKTMTWTIGHPSILDYFGKEGVE